MRSEGYGLSASVCPCSNSLLDGIFVPQTIRRNKRVISQSNGFLWKCSVAEISALPAYVGHFLLAENEHAHSTWPSRRERRSCVPWVAAIVPPKLLCDFLWNFSVAKLEREKANMQIHNGRDGLPRSDPIRVPRRHQKMQRRACIASCMLSS